MTFSCASTTKRKRSRRKSAPCGRDSPPCCAPSSTPARSSANFDDTPPAEALALAEHLAACVTDGASSSVSVGSLTALGAYLATRRTKVDRLRSEPAPKRVHAIEDAHRRATLDAAAAPAVLAPADSAGADSAPSATKSAIGQCLTRQYRADVMLLLDSPAIAGPIANRIRQRGDPAGAPLVPSEDHIMERRTTEQPNDVFAREFGFHPPPPSHRRTSGNASNRAVEAQLVLKSEVGTPTQNRWGRAQFELSTRCEKWLFRSSRRRNFFVFNFFNIKLFVEPSL